jgi:hypothetical protein
MGGIRVALVLASGLGLAVIARRRRRSALPPPAAPAMTEAATQTLAQPVPSRIPNLPPAGDEDVPRWRRPSVAAARYGNGNTSAIRSAPAGSTIRTRPARAFAEPTEVLGARTVVRYGVPLLNRPDEAFGRALGNLASGDQVEILDHGDIWANVITPSGAAGWVPSATLGPMAGKRDGDGEDPAHGLEPGASPPDVEPPSLETLFEAARRARAETAHEPDSTPGGIAARTQPAEVNHEDRSAGDGGPTGSDGRRNRPRRRPKLRSTTRPT